MKTSILLLLAMLIMAMALPANAVAEPGIDLTKTVDEPNPCFGDVVTYTICIANTGDWPLENVVVTDPDLGVGPLPGFPTVLAPGNQACENFPYEVQEDDPCPLVNCAMVTANPLDLPDELFDEDCAELCPVPCGEPGIDLTKTVDKPNPCFGDVVTYTICIANTGDWPLENVVVTDSLLGGELPGFPPMLWPGEVFCADFPYEVQEDDPCPLVNCAMVTANPLDSLNAIEDEDCAEFCPEPCDSDGDGLTDEEELAGWDITIYDCVGNSVDSYHVTSYPYDPDIDGDGLTDLEEKEGWDVRYRLENPNFPPRWIWIEYHVASNPREADVDSDGLNDWQERVHKTDPSRANTDCDGAWDTNDGFEIDYGLNPLDFDTDNDGLSDGLEIDLWIQVAGYDPEQPELVPPEILSEAAAQTNDPVIPSSIDIDPDTLNLKSKGNRITAYIELPEGYDVAHIDIGSILLNGEVPAENKPTEIGDYDDDGLPDLMVKFDRSDVCEILDPWDEVEITVIGELTDETPFQGSDTIRVIDEGGEE